MSEGTYAPRQALEDSVPADLFKMEVKAWALKIGVQTRDVHIRPMSRKWASCSTNGRLTFNIALLEEPASFRREVIVHELLHLKIPDHGRVFKALLRAYLAEQPTN